MRTHQAFDEVDFGAAEEFERDLVDEHACAVPFDQDVFVRLRVVDVRDAIERAIGIRDDASSRRLAGNDASGCRGSEGSCRGS